MKVANAVKKLEKLTGKTVTKNQNNLYSVVIGQNVISFYPNGRDSADAEITCIKTRRINDVDDSMSDYSAGCFHDNITQAYNFIAR
jgi:hypothetical protein